MHMKKEKNNEFDINELVLQPFEHRGKKASVIMGIVKLLLVIFPFFSVSNWREGLAAIFCVVILIILSYNKGKWGKRMWCIWSGILVVNLLLTSFVGAPFGGLLTNESVQQRKENKYYRDFAAALYELSICDYESALKSFKQIKNIVPEEYLLEYYLWYGETAMYAQKYELSIDLLNEAEKNIIEYSKEEGEVLFKFIPICKMVNYYNIQEFDSLTDMANQYQNTNEQIFNIFELASLCVQGNIVDNERRIRELISQYPNMQDSFENLKEIKLEMMAVSAAALTKEYPEYAIILYAQLFEENKSFFYETFLYCYPTENNLLNMRWFSLDYLQRMKEIYAEGLRAFQRDSSDEFRIYSEVIDELGYYLGIEKLLLQKSGVEDSIWCVDKKVDEWELYNVIRLVGNSYLGIWLEPMETEIKENMPQVAATAHFYLFQVKNEQLYATPLIIDNQKYTKNVAMNKLFLVESTGMKDKFLIESIEGTGEYLSLELMDINNKTCEIIEDNTELYHTSGFEFDKNTNQYVAEFEIENFIDANMDTKVGGRIIADIDFERNIVQTEINYPDPAVEFYVKERNEALIFPLENLNTLKGKEIKNKTLLEKIRQNSIPYYKYSLIQQSYEYFLEIAQCKLSGITIVYDANTDEEASFFYLVKRDADMTELMGIYEIVNGKLENVY